MEIIKRLDQVKQDIKKAALSQGERKKITETLDAAMDIIYDSGEILKTYKALLKKYETEDPDVRYNDGSWHCPVCFKRVHPMAHFCNWCGKRLRKGGGRYDRD